MKKSRISICIIAVLLITSCKSPSSGEIASGEVSHSNDSLNSTENEIQNDGNNRGVFLVDSGNYFEMKRIPESAGQDEIFSLFCDSSIPNTSNTDIIIMVRDTYIDFDNTIIAAFLGWQFGPIDYKVHDLGSKEYLLTIEGEIIKPPSDKAIWNTLCLSEKTGGSPNPNYCFAITGDGQTLEDFFNEAGLDMAAICS